MGQKGFGFLVPEAGQAHDAGEIAHFGVGGELGGDLFLALGKVSQWAVVCQPVGVPSLWAAFNDDVRVMRVDDWLQWRAVQVGPKGSDGNDAGTVSAGLFAFMNEAITLVDHDEGTGTLLLELFKRCGVLGQGSMKYAGQAQGFTILVVVEGLEREDAARVEQAEKRLGC